MTTKLTGKIEYTIEFDESNFNVKFNETDELGGIKNTLASASFMRIVGESTLKHMLLVKKNDRALYNSLYKKVFHEATRLVSELKNICNGTITDLVEYLKNNPQEEVVSKVTVQNEVKEN